MSNMSYKLMDLHWLTTYLKYLLILNMLRNNARLICTTLCSIEACPVFPWVWQVAEDKLGKEILELSQVGNGLHFNASQCASWFVEGSFMKGTAWKIHMKGPYIHHLIDRLLNANPLSQWVAPLCDSKVTQHDILDEFSVQRLGLVQFLDLDHLQLQLQLVVAAHLISGNWTKLCTTSSCQSGGCTPTHLNWSYTEPVEDQLCTWSQPVLQY